MIPKMKDKLFLSPELAPLFTAKQDDLQKVLGSLTRLLDGHGLENDSGAHGHRRYGDTMFVGIGAAVEIPPKVWKLLGTLGHKVYFLRPELKEKSVKELKYIAKKNNFGDKFKEIEETLLEYLKIFEAAPEAEGKVIGCGINGLAKIRWNEEIEGEQDKSIEYIAEIARLLAHLRGTVDVRQSINLAAEREPNSILEPEYYLEEPIREDASRAVILLRNLAIGHAISRGRDSISFQDIPIVLKVAFSTTTAPRAKVFDLLIKNNGKLSTSEITSHLKMSYPTARRIMEELHFLDIVYSESVAEYANSEVKITLKEEYRWFKNDEFRRLAKEVNVEQKENQGVVFGHAGKSSSKELLDKEDIPGSETDNPTSQSKHNFQDHTLLACDSVTCHTLKKNLPHTQTKEIFSEIINKKEIGDQENRSCADPIPANYSHKSAENNRDYIEEVNYTNRSNRNNSIAGQDTEQEYSVSNYSNYDNSNINEQLIGRDDNSTKNLLAPLGSKYFQRVTASYDENDDICHMGSDSKIDTRIENIPLQEVLSVIESAKSHDIAVSTAVASTCNAHNQIRNYLGDKLTTRENRRIRDLYLRIIRHPNIEVIKYKPQLIVKWLDKEQSSETVDQDSG
jgi:hypothetical protein